RVDRRADRTRVDTVFRRNLRAERLCIGSDKRSGGEENSEGGLNSEVGHFFLSNLTDRRWEPSAKIAPSDHPLATLSPKRARTTPAVRQLCVRGRPFNPSGSPVSGL